MRIWPILLDAQPAYLRGRGRSSSLLLAPLGTSTLIQHVISSLQPNTGNPPLVVSHEDSHDDYPRWIHTLCPTAMVMGSSERFTEVLAGCELSDALLILDPRLMPAAGFQFSELLRHYAADPRVAHHLVALEASVAGTKERVSFDNGGNIRSIQRYYEQTTWPFIAGIAATVIPVACDVLADGYLPRSVGELRALLLSRGVPSRDIPLQGGALDLTRESGLLEANEHLVLKAMVARQQTSGETEPLYLGDGHSVHATARIIGPVVIHADVRIDEHATVVGPAVIGPGARIGSGAIVAHATVGADCIVRPNQIVRDRAWFNTDPVAERSQQLYGERLERLSAGAVGTTQNTQTLRPAQRAHPILKRTLDVTVSAISMAILLPILALAAAAIWLESRGPIFYRDKREGRQGRVFGCWKFRTMYTGAHLAQRELGALDQTDGPHFKVDRDPRVTQAGRILRALNLDELPQLLNVLVGEMSLVGPRPSPFRENQVCVPWREARLSVRPGITGFWQVCRHDRAGGDFHQWIEYDLLYVQHQSLWLDLKILVATLVTLGGKAAHVPSSWLVERRGPATWADAAAGQEIRRRAADALV